MAVAGGLALFLYGMKLTGESLQRTAGRRMRKLVRGLTGNRMVGLLIGFLATLITNSSSATSLMVVNFVGAGLMALEQGIAVTLGACVGTSVAVQVIAFKISQYALLLIAVGFLISMVFRKETWVAVGTVIFAAGLVFFGIHLMSQGLEPLATSDVFVRNIIQFNASPWLAFGAATALAVLTQSGSATIAVLLALLMHKGAAVQVSAVSGIAWVIGANLGTASTGVLGSLRSAADGKRVALAHVAFKAIGGVVCLLAVIRFGWFVRTLDARGIANVHLLYNLVNVALFLPLLWPLAALCRIVIRRKPYAMMSLEEIESSRLDEALLATPEAALTRSRSEIVEICGIAREMIEHCIDTLEAPDGRLIERIKQSDDRIDRKTVKITRFLTALSRRNLSWQMSEEVIRQLSIADDLENMGDVVSNTIVGIALKLPKKGKQIAADDLDRLRTYHGHVVEFTHHVFRLLVEEDEEAARMLMMRYEELEEEARQVRHASMERMSRGAAESLSASAIYFDLQYAIRRIATHARDIVISIET